MILYIILLIIIILMVAAGYDLSNRALYIRLHTEEEILDYEAKAPNFHMAWFDSVKEKVTILSPFGYKLAGYYIPAERVSNKTVIFCHGVTSSHISAIKYVRMYRQRGWNMLVYDHRRHGGSEGKMTTYGFFEKHDLKAVVDFVREKTGQDCIIGIHGESMGAATLLQYAGMEDGANFYIADCPYSSLWEELTHVLKKNYHLPAFPFLYISNVILYWRAKFWIKDVNPMEDVKKIEKPVLFIHGAADTFVPTNMSVKMFEVKEKGYRELYLSSDAKHAKSMLTNPEAYEKAVFTFLKNAGISD